MGHQKISYEEIRKTGFIGYIKIHNLSPQEVSKIVSAYWKEDIKIYKTAKPFNGIKNILKILSNKHKLGILTSNKVEIVQSFLDKYKLNFFDFVYSEKGVFSKYKRLKEIVSKHNLKKVETYYIGDETRDIEAAKKQKINAIAVNWGAESNKLLKMSKPDLIITKPNDLLKIWN